MCAFNRKTNFSFPVSTLVGSSHPNLKKVVKGRRIDKKFRKKYLLTSTITRILDIFRWMEESRYNSKIENFQITEAPVFIIGFWRSGTTLLHNLLCQHPDYGYVTTYQGVFPNHCLMHQWWLRRIAQLIIPERRPGDNLKLDFSYPQEEDIALGNMQAISFYYFFYFPDDFDEFLEKGLLFQNVSEEDRKNWQEAYIKLVKTALINTGKHSFISKNPPNGFRIKQILELFPEAKFIYIHRDPYQTIVSFQNFVHLILDGIRLQDYDKEVLNMKLIRLFKLFQDKYYEDKNLIPEGNLAEIRFEDFEKNKIAGIESIYKTLNLPDFEKSLPLMEKYLEEIGEYGRKEHEIHEGIRQMIKRELEGSD